MSNRDLALATVGVIACLLAAPAVFAQVPVRFDPFNPKLTLRLLGNGADRTSASMLTASTENSTPTTELTTTETTATDTKEVTGPEPESLPGRPPVRDPMRPPTRSPVRP